MAEQLLSELGTWMLTGNNASMLFIILMDLNSAPACGLSERRDRISCQANNVKRHTVRCICRSWASLWTPKWRRRLRWHILRLRRCRRIPGWRLWRNYSSGCYRNRKRWGSQRRVRMSRRLGLLRQATLSDLPTFPPKWKAFICLFFFVLFLSRLYLVWIFCRESDNANLWRIHVHEAGSGALQGYTSNKKYCQDYVREHGGEIHHLKEKGELGR